MATERSVWDSTSLQVFLHCEGLPLVGEELIYTAPHPMRERKEK